MPCSVAAALEEILIEHLGRLKGKAKLTDKEETFLSWCMEYVDNRQQHDKQKEPMKIRRTLYKG